MLSPSAHEVRVKRNTFDGRSGRVVEPATDKIPLSGAAQRHRRRRIAVLVACLLALIALGWTYLSPLPSLSTARGTALRYYRLLSVGRRGDADVLVSPEYRAMRASANAGQSSDDGLSALVGLFGLTASPPVAESADALAQDGAYTAGYRDVQDVEVRFVQLFPNDTQTPGGQVWFLVLGRKGAGGPWRILSFGTGG
jgi:hypothetical protein